jgi:hypothetical protein
MHKTLICLEKRDFHRIVDVSRQYAGGDLDKCYIFNKKGYTAELCQEKVINGVNCVIFGWSNYNLDLTGLEHGYDLSGIIFELDKSKKGYILMEFENNMLVNFKDKSKIKELGQAMNIDRVIRDDFSLVYDENEKKIEKEEEEEFE